MFILIDNYDSFTWNLVQYFGELGVPTDVYRNDKISSDDVIAQKPDGIILSPGPGTPDESGICLELITKADNADIPLLGICLGHQSIGQIYGGVVKRGPEPVHGKCHRISHTGKGLFKNIADQPEVTRYHSLIVERDTLPDMLEVTAETEDGIIMGLMHKDKPIHGLQFHPESIATEHGHDLLKNFVDIAKAA